MSDVLIVAVPLLIVVLVAYFCYDQQAAIYEQMVAILERERDEAKQEARVFRGLLFPVLSRTESSGAGSSPVAPIPSAARSSKVEPMRGNQPAQSFYRRRPARVPFRQLFNLKRKQTNTPQQRTDALASALEQQKIPSGEKNHAAS